ncbi:MAG TPA: carboxypeptidase regulatory-like domain-containing protein, partial [Planctomycetes bacterium]|nr:carboxypeptidase regulatory-like domain-containing protein [Planctomycetota bacterium]
MTKKTFVPLGIVALLVVLLAFLLNEGDSPVPVDFELSFAEETSSTEPWVEAGRAEPTVSQGPVVDLGEGNAAISGKVIEPQGGVAGGARVALLRSSLLASVEQEGGVSMWNVVDFGRVFSSSNHLSSLMPLRKDLIDGLTVLARATADDDGHYSFTGVPAGRFVVAAQKDGSLISPSPSVLYLEDEQVEVDVRLIQAAYLSGSVRSERGDAIAEADILLRGRVFDTSSGM